jgi:hypothetical protein
MQARLDRRERLKYQVLMPKRRMLAGNLTQLTDKLRHPLSPPRGNVRPSLRGGTHAVTERHIYFSTQQFQQQARYMMT